jgi:hypothetical protein
MLDIPTAFSNGIRNIQLEDDPDGPSNDPPAEPSGVGVPSLQPSLSPSALPTSAESNVIGPDGPILKYGICRTCSGCVF